MHMLPGTNVPWKISDAYGNILNNTLSEANFTNRVWDFDLKTQKWSVSDAGNGDQPQDAAVAYDLEKQVGWYYGGYYIPDTYSNENISEVTHIMSPGYPPPPPSISLQNLCRLDRGKGAPVKVETDSSIVGNVTAGELVYIGGAGEAGILVLIGGYIKTPSIVMVIEPDPKQ